jgi:tetratricopeptide (TPR) repeat protein
LIAEIGTNQAYVEALIGNYATAEALLADAVHTHRRHSSPEFVGYSLSVQGEVYRYQKRFTESYDCYEQALLIFSEAQNPAWEGQIRQQMAIGLIQADPSANVDEAIFHIDQAIWLCNEYNARAYPSALQRAGRIYAASGRSKEALDYLSQGIEAARAVSDNWFLVAGCVERAELVYRLWVATNDAVHRDEIFEHQGIVEGMEGTAEYAFRDLFGRWHLLRGHVAWHDGKVGGQASRWQDALQEYTKGFSLIATGYYGSHGISALPREGRVLRKHIAGLPQAEAKRWCDALNEAWKGQGHEASILQAIVSSAYDEAVFPVERGSGA